MRKIEIKNIENTKSEIIIQNGLIENIFDFLDENKRYFLITNETIYKIYSKFILKKFFCAIFQHIVSGIF